MFRYGHCMKIKIKRIIDAILDSGFMRPFN